MVKKFYSQNSKNNESNNKTNKQIRTKSNDFVKNNDEICKINGGEFSQICLQGGEILRKDDKEIRDSRQIYFKNSTAKAKFYRTNSNQNIKICEKSAKTDEIYSQNKAKFYTQNSKENR